MGIVKTMLEFESNRKASNVPDTMMRWVKEGQFYHAYEWSAWIAYRYVNEFKALRRKTKENDYVYVGFPPDSLDKFTPNNARVNISEDGIVVDMFLPENTIDQSVAYEDLLKQFNDWKNSVVFQKNGGNGAEQSVVKELKNVGDKSPMRMTDIMMRIMRFNVTMKSPFDCQNFIIEIQQLISNSL